MIKSMKEEEEEGDLFAVGSELYPPDEEKEKAYRDKHPDHFTEHGERITKAMRKEAARQAFRLVSRANRGAKRKAREKKRNAERAAFLDSMDSPERKRFVNAEWAAHYAMKARLKEAQEKAPIVVIDAAYDHLMNERERLSLVR